MELIANCQNLTLSIIVPQDPWFKDVTRNPVPKIHDGSGTKPAPGSAHLRKPGPRPTACNRPVRYLHQSVPPFPEKHDDLYPNLVPGLSHTHVVG